LIENIFQPVSFKTIYTLFKADGKSSFRENNTLGGSQLKITMWYEEKESSAIMCKIGTRLKKENNSTWAKPQNSQNKALSSTDVLQIQVEQEVLTLLAQSRILLQ